MTQPGESPDVSSPREGTDPDSPAALQVYQFLVFGLSLPERAIRTTSGVLGGAVKESASLLVPMAFRNSRSYRAMVGEMLDFLVNDVGGVKSSDSAEATPEVENYVARKSVSSFIDLAGMATFHVSPLAVMAIVSDLAHGSNIYLKSLSDELKQQGVIAEDSTIDSTADLLAAVGAASGTTADALGTPPLSLEGLKETVAQVGQAMARDDQTVMSSQEIQTTWEEMSEQAAKEGVNLFEISSAMTLATLNGLSAATNGALSTIRVTGNMFDRHIFSHYKASLADIGERGIYSVVADTSRPYIEAVWFNFSSERPTLTGDLLSGKLFGQAWQGMRA